MKDFNIAKYLKEHNLGPHGILGKYVDLQPLKEEKVPVKQGGIYPTKEAAQKIADVCITAGMTGVEVREVAKNKFKVFADPGQELANEGDYGNNEPVYDEPYEGPEDPIDGLGGKLDRDMDVSMNEMDYDMDGEEDVENAWMEEVDGTEAYKIGNWTCYYDHPGILVWSYQDVPLSKLAVYATPNWDGDETTPIQIEVNNDVRDNMTLRQAEFANFNEYATAMKPYLDQIEDLEYNWGSLAPTDEALDLDATDDNTDTDRIMDLGGSIIEKGIISLIDDGFDAEDILDLCKMFIQAHSGARSMGKKF